MRDDQPMQADKPPTEDSMAILLALLQVALQNSTAISDLIALCRGENREPTAEELGALNDNLTTAKTQLQVVIDGMAS